MKTHWKVGIVYDTTYKSKGHHGTHFSFTGLPGVELVLADPNEADLTPRMQAIGAARHYHDYHRMIETERPDIVVACSRIPAEHFDVINAALEAGSHVLCEKPLTASLEEADKIRAMAEQRGRKVAVAHLARHALVFRTMKRMIERGDIGRPLTVYGRGKEDERGGGEDMLVLGTHILDLFAFLFGAPDDVFADVRIEGRRIRRIDRNQTSEPVGVCAGDSVWASFRFSGGVNGVFESRRGLCTGPVRMGITVAGTEGCLSVRYDQDRALRLSRSPFPPEDEAHYETVALREDRVVPEGAAPPDYEQYGPTPTRYFADNNRFAALDLLRAIEEDRRPAASVQDAAGVMEMIYGIYSSALTQAAVPLPLANRKHPLGD